MGVETEYAFVGLSKNGGGVDLDGLANDLMRTARQSLVHLPDAGGAGIYLENGSRLYVDAGSHPEMAGPECSTPWDVVRYIEAGERTLVRIADAVTERRVDVAETLGFKCNVDYSSESRSTWGCHESYLHRMDPTELPHEIIPHLVSRIIYTGAGGFNSLEEGIEFLVSPRAPHLVAASSSNSTHNRGIFHTKDESLSGPGYHRLHVISGESLCSRTGSWLKVATTALVVALSEAGLSPGAGIQLDNPIKALRSIAADPKCEVAVELKEAGQRTAIEIQRHYLEQALAHLSNAHMPPWADVVCHEWGRMLDALEGAPESVSRQLDWAIKWTLYSDYLQRAGRTWADVSMICP